MLRVANRFSAVAAKRNISQPPRRFAHGVHYGPEEPLGYYLKWVAGLGAFVGLLTYDRFYSKGAISNLVTPETKSDAIEEQRLQYADRLVREQERNVELLFPRQRTTHLTNFSARPVPSGPHRSDHTGDSLDLETVGERRPRLNK